MIRSVLMDWWLRVHGVQCEGGFLCVHPVYFDVSSGGKISLGRNVSVNRNVTIDAADGGEIVIGSNVFIGPNTVLRASNHDYVRLKGHVPGRIVVGDNVWIGANCTVVPGVTIGSGSVIGGGSVVCKDVPENVVAVGNPCRTVKRIYRETGRS